MTKEGYGTPAESQDDKLQTICELLTLIHNEVSAINKILRIHENSGE